MAYKETLADDIANEISNQISDLLPGLVHQQSPSPQSAELRESFEVWTLDLRAPDGKIRLDSARVTGGWHHQILFDGKAAAHAESVMTEAGDLRVAEVSVSPLARNVEEAIKWADRLEDSVTVRLLALPSLLIYTFWLVQLQQIYIIEAFPEFKHLKPGSLLSEDEFESFLYSNLKSLETRSTNRERKPEEEESSQ